MAISSGSTLFSKSGALFIGSPPAPFFLELGLTSVSYFSSLIGVSCFLSASSFILLTGLSFFVRVGFLEIDALRPCCLASFLYLTTTTTTTATIAITAITHITIMINTVLLFLDFSSALAGLELPTV